MRILTIYCDGGCFNNQDANKRFGYGSFIILENNTMIESNQFEYGRITNNEAEYFALTSALDHVISMKKEDEEISLIIKTDSQLVEGHLMKGWKTNQRMWTLVMGVKHKLNTNFKSWKIEHISGTDMKKILGH